jgi:hypothetical protein
MIRYQLRMRSAELTGGKDIALVLKMSIEEAGLSQEMIMESKTATRWEPTQLPEISEVVGSTSPLSDWVSFDDIITLCHDYGFRELIRKMSFDI